MAGWIPPYIYSSSNPLNVIDPLGLFSDENGNAKLATYNGADQLTAVSFPDGRSESFTYHASGKLASLTEAGVGGSPTRAWSYTWTDSGTGDFEHTEPTYSSEGLLYSRRWTRQRTYGTPQDNAPAPCRDGPWSDR